MPLKRGLSAIAEHLVAFDRVGTVGGKGKGQEGQLPLPRCAVDGPGISNSMVIA